MSFSLKSSEWDSLFGGLIRGKNEGGNDQNMGVFGMLIFLASLSVLFLSSMVGVIVVRLRADEWVPEGAAGPPMSLWISTAVILGCSFAVHRALLAARSGAKPKLVRWLIVTLFLGVVFLILQTYNWWELHVGGVTPRTGLYGFTFWVMTVLHGLHVIGGLLPLGIVTTRAAQGAYAPEFHPGVVYMALYWHFLDVAWLIILAIILLGAR
jgi:cytochrome c oxidase subunit 3